MPISHTGVSFLCTAFFLSREWILRFLESEPSAIKDLIAEEEVREQLSQASHRQIQFLRRLLRQFPYWRRGHQWIAELLFADGALQEAYAACQTARILAEQQCPQNTEEIRALTLLRAQISLGVGGYEEVVTLYSSRGVSSSRAPSFSREEREVLAAAHMALGSYEEARLFLEYDAQPERGGKRSGVLSYLRARD
ncbi:hypothetical protein MRY87_12225 [bacterium]|nr:hypothetical protein [bacterium]